MLNKDSQAEIEVQASTTADCTNVKPPYTPNPMLQAVWAIN